MGEFLDAVKGSPLLLAVVVLIGGLVYLVEKLGGIDGPITRLYRAWHNRELAKIKRDALLRAERRRLELADEDDKMAVLRADVMWLRNERDDQRRRDRVRDQHDRELGAYVWHILQAARSAGLAFPDPPGPPDLAPMFVQGDELDKSGTASLPASRNPARALPPPG